MPSPIEVLITITGMGDPQTGDTDEWIRKLWPGAPFATHGDRRWVELSPDRKIYLFEVKYEKENDAFREKLSTVSSLLPGGTPEVIGKSLDEYFGDVWQNVLVGDQIVASQLRFSNEYRRAIALIGQLDPTLDLRKARISVLAHSLGTLVAYEGLYRVFETPEIMMAPSMVNLVLCAPMLSPMHAVQSGLSIDRFLTRYGCTRPKRTNAATNAVMSNIRRCLGIYNTSDPFYLIQKNDFYRRQGADLMDEYIRFDANPGWMFWKAHAMVGSYIENNRDKILEVLFA
jgi:hypothetical protein